jgi:hypothetical protein
MYQDKQYQSDAVVNLECACYVRLIRFRSSSVLPGLQVFRLGEATDSVLRSVRGLACASAGMRYTPSAVFVKDGRRSQGNGLDPTGTTRGLYTCAPRILKCLMRVLCAVDGSFSKLGALTRVSDVMATCGLAQGEALLSRSLKHQRQSCPNRRRPKRHGRMQTYTRLQRLSSTVTLANTPTPRSETTCGSTLPSAMASTRRHCGPRPTSSSARSRRRVRAKSTTPYQRPQTCPHRRQ